MWRLVWKLAFERATTIDSLDRGLIRSTGTYTYAEWYADTLIAAQSQQFMPRDSVRRWGAAFQLANLFSANSVGATEGMAYAAASLYKVWRLPPQPAAAFLADPAYSIAARNKALRALEPYWSTDVFRNAAAAALCTLAAKAAGTVTLRRDTVLDETEALDDDEHQFFSDVLWALGTVDEAGGPSPVGVIAQLPPNNPVTLWMTKWLAR